MSNPLDAEALAARKRQACQLYIEKLWSMKRIAKKLRIRPRTARRWIIEEGGKIRTKIPDTPERQRRAYEMYVVEGLPLAEVSTALHVHNSKAKRWILAEGGTMRSKARRIRPGHKPATPHLKRWGAGVKCAIGGVMEQGSGRGLEHVPIGSYYCAGYCDHHDGMCGVEVTPENRAGFEAFKARRAEDARKRRGDGDRKRRRVALTRAGIRSYETRA